MPFRSPNDSTPLLEFADVTRRFRVGDEWITALDRVSFRLDAGERMVLIGRSGSGKSTLLNLAAGLDRPTAGRVLFDGTDLAECSSGRLSTYRRRRLGIVFQSYHLMPTQTALENVEWPLMLDGRPVRDRRSLALQALADVGLSDRIGHRPHQLSGGQQQRVAIARAIVHEPSLIVADEPTGNLDARTADTVMGLIDELTRRRGHALLLVTHDARWSASTGFRTLRLSDGRPDEPTDRDPFHEASHA